MAKGTIPAALLAGLSVLLCACGSSGGARPPATEATAPSAQVSQGPTVIVKGQSPVQLYAHIARQIKGCWLNPRSPTLKNHVFRAEAGAGGRSGTATNIRINEKTRDKKRGLLVFSIDFMAVRDGTQIVSQNHKLPDALGQKFVSDIGYWAQGGANCHGPARTPVTSPHIQGPRVSR